MKGYLFILWCVICGQLVNSEDLSAEECLELGFNRDNLQCSSCNMLQRYELNSLQDVCSLCCGTQVEVGIDADGSTKSTVAKYPKATLEICNCNLGSYPQVQAFVRNGEASKFTNLQVNYIGGQKPQIRLLNSEGVPQETLSITKWDTDTIIEFLQTYLE